MTSRRENVLRAVRFEKPEYIPMNFAINGACWHHYPPDALPELMAEHRFLFPDFKPAAQPAAPEYAPWQRAGKPYTDAWSCVWETTDDGITGTVTGHPLATWDAFPAYTPPDPQKSNGLEPLDWDRIGQDLRRAKTEGRLAAGGLRHGHTFMTLANIRGYANLLYDMVDNEPRLHRLIHLLEEFNLATVRNFLNHSVEWMSYPEDLGMQCGPMVAPEHFRKFIQPSYRRLMAPACAAGCVVHMHSDGDIRDLLPDLVEGGVEVINLQDLVNGIDWIREKCKGRMCVDLDLDRQRITRFGTPAQVDALILEAVRKLGAREGGLMMVFGLYPGTPLENIKALMDAMEKYAGYYA